MKSKDRVISVSRGTPTSVEFDYDQYWGYWRQHQPSVVDLEFWHVHPAGMLTYSATDLDCIQGLSVAFGHPIRFGIVAFRTHDLWDLAHDLVMCRFAKGQMLTREVRIGDPDTHITLQDLAILKALAYCS